MTQKWKKDEDGDHTLVLPSGASAWIAKGASSHSHPSWYGAVTTKEGAKVRISGWSLRSAKSHAETALGLKGASC
jgi:hypothetical protein